MSTPPRTVDRGSRVVAGVAVRVTELVWPDERRSYEVHLINGDVDGDVDLTEDGCFDDPPTDAQISELLAEYRAATTLAGWATSAGLLPELLARASARIGWQVDLDQLPVTCAHTPHLVLALIDASAAHLAALAAHTALTEAAQSIQTIIAEQDRDTVDWFVAGLLGSIAQLANSRSPQLGHSRRALLAALSALQQEGVAWPPDPTPPTTTQPPTTQPTLAGPVTATGSANNR